MKFLVGVLCVAFLAMPITAWIEDGIIRWDNNCRWDNRDPFDQYGCPAYECGEICRTTDGCKAFDWDPSKSRCLLYAPITRTYIENGWLCGYIEFPKSAGNSTLDN